jgi:hypothetical protein
VDLEEEHLAVVALNAEAVVCVDAGVVDAVDPEGVEDAARTGKRSGSRSPSWAV